MNSSTNSELYITIAPSTGSITGSTPKFHLGENELNPTGRSTTVLLPGAITFLSSDVKIAISKIESFLDLPVGWNGYNAPPPSHAAISNAIDFLVRNAYLQFRPYFIAPTPQGDVLIELQKDGASLEFIFSASESEVTGYYRNQTKFEHPLNDTTEASALRWLICPDGDCVNC